MDIDGLNFQAKLPQVLRHVSDAHFVAFDLEMSGIPPRNNGPGSNTLQTRYAECKAAAEKYHILQFGITCVEEDASTGCYLLRPYNFNISPLAHDDFGIERSFTYSASAVKFLIRNGYDMASPFEKGVCYLTRAETADARSNWMKRHDRDSIPDVFIHANDTRLKPFMARVKSDIQNWLDTRKPSQKNFEIRNPNPLHPHAPLPLDRLERRLVHQIVRSDFLDLQSSSRRDGVVVEFADKKAQEQIRRNNVQRIFNGLKEGVGFRWVAEALAGTYEQEASALESGNANNPQGNGSAKRAPKVLLGHNCFMDLIFIYKLFYGTLPESVEDFQAELHRVFPNIIDNKLLATEDESMAANRSLQLSDLESFYSVEDEQPSMQVPADHAAGLGTTADKYHEAGYDSFVTAKVFIRLATKMGKRVLQDPLPLTAQDLNGANTSKKSKKKKKKDGMTAAEANERFASKNPYETLSDEDMEEAVQGIEESIAEKPTSTSNSRHDEAVDVTAIVNDMARLTVNGNSKIIPRWDDDYWKKYGNKLRVNGTIEQKLALGAPVSVADAVEKEVSNEPPRHEASSAEPPTGSALTESTPTASEAGAENGQPSRRVSVLQRFKKVLSPFE